VGGVRGGETKNYFCGKDAGCEVGTEGKKKRGSVMMIAKEPENPGKKKLEVR